MTDWAIEPVERWLSCWIDDPEALAVQWETCAPPLRLTLGHRWVGMTTGEVDPTMSWNHLTPDNLHPLATDAFEGGPVGIPAFGTWLAGYMSSFTITGHGCAMWHLGAGAPPVPTLLIQLDHGRLDLAILTRNGSMEVAPCQITDGLTPV